MYAREITLSFIIFCDHIPLYGDVNAVKLIIASHSNKSLLCPERFSYRASQVHEVL